LYYIINWFHPPNAHSAFCPLTLRAHVHAHPFAHPPVPLRLAPPNCPHARAPTPPTRLARTLVHTHMCPCTRSAPSTKGKGKFFFLFVLHLRAYHLTCALQYTLRAAIPPHSGLHTCLPIPLMLSHTTRPVPYPLPCDLDALAPAVMVHPPLCKCL
jgi:hypothetical protein